MLVLRALKQILPAHTLGFWDGKIVFTEKKIYWIISTYESSLETKMYSWHKILRVCTQIAICETYVETSQKCQIHLPSVGKLYEQGAGWPSIVGLCALVEEHLELSHLSPLRRRVPSINPPAPSQPAESKDFGRTEKKEMLMLKCDR